MIQLNKFYQKERKTMLKTKNGWIKVYALILSLCALAGAGFVFSVSAIGIPPEIAQFIRAKYSNVIPDEISNVICNIDTSVSNMGYDDVASELIRQFCVYLNRDKSIFIFDSDFEFTDPRTTLLILQQTNKIFEEYPVFTDCLIKSKKLLGETFGLGIFLPDYDNPFDLPCYSISAAGIFFNAVLTIMPYTQYLGTEILFKNANPNFYPPSVSNGKLIESYLAHEMGHQIFSTIVEESCRFYKCFLDSLEVAECMKENIVAIANNNYGGNTDIVSDYGKENAKEWFAEVFAELECSDNPSPLACAARDYLDSLMKNKLILPEEQVNSFGSYEYWCELQEYWKSKLEEVGNDYDTFGAKQAALIAGMDPKQAEYYMTELKNFEVLSGNKIFSFIKKHLSCLAHNLPHLACFFEH